ncbi:HypC/HybG/HupF family hydrogenase formation chaperone [candidate division WOR-3 bacterium]|nr:HypC/HybG/HupF family hydrogenase formation chaperone [candidate division WOR-3 bacterium]
MCIGIPAKVIEITGTSGKVDYQGVKREASFLMLPGVKAGDYVILHAGFAIKKLSEEDAKETLRLIQEMVRVEKGLDA